ncbi:MAG: hypothetical protein RLZZ435_1313 [Cyanobacteriota bacterium]
MEWLSTESEKIEWKSEARSAALFRLKLVARGVPYRYEADPARSLLRKLTYRGVLQISTFVTATVVA